ALREFRCSFNRISQFPEGVIQLPKLEILDLSNNLISSVPETITNMKSLRALLLSNNSLKDLPYSLGNMLWLNTLQIEGNPLRTIRWNIISGGTHSILSYLRSKLPDNNLRQSRSLRPSSPDLEIQNLEKELQRKDISEAKKYSLK